MNQSKLIGKNERLDRSLRGCHEVRQATQEPLECKEAPLGPSLYFHIPFCLKKCAYCDFVSETGSSSNQITEYTEALCLELGHREALGWSRGVVSTVFFGGGTPTMMPASQLEQILEATHRAFPLSEQAEITIEINPETVTLELAKTWRKLGFNRASLGVQSLHDPELAQLGRIHSSERATQAYGQLRQAGFDNISVDLIYALPNQALSSWIQTLDQVSAWAPEHVSAYQLTLETGTPMERDWQHGVFQLPQESLQIEFLQSTRERLHAQGLEAYEISNYAQPGLSCRHNLAYWTGKEYWGLGVSAHSFARHKDRVCRFWHSKNLGTYLSGVQTSESLDLEREILSPEQLGFDLLMTGLRLENGIDVKELESFPDVHLPPSTLAGIQRHVQTKHLTWDGPCLLFTREGREVSDEIFRELLP